MKKTIYIGMIKRTYSNEPYITIQDSDMTEYYRNDDGTVFFELLETQVIDVPDLPSKERLVEIEIDGLQRLAEEIRAETSRKLADINERINNLRCLEHQEPADDA